MAHCRAEREFRLSVTPAQPRLGAIAGWITSSGGGGPIAMPNHEQPDPGWNRRLGVSIAAALAVKAAALTALYLAFFVPAPNPTPPAERGATAILGLPGR